MYKDLDSKAWPNDKKPNDHPVIKALLSEGFRDLPSIVSDEEHLDELMNPQDVHQVLDADSSQTLAILDINNGHNIVIQGPPGTGKSQTITNVIAEAIGRGKKVLFVSEKMAALEVVKRRLDLVGLGDAVLELHSHKTNKKILLKELDRTLNLGRPIQKNADDDIKSFVEMRNRLNAYCEAANKPILTSNLSPVKAIGCFLNLGKDASTLPRMDFATMKSWSTGDYKNNRLRVEELQHRLKSMGVPRKNPFWGAERKKILLPTDEEQLKQLLNTAKEGTKRIKQNASILANNLNLNSPNTLHDLELTCRAAIRASEAPHLQGIRLKSGEWQARRDELKYLINSGSQLSSLHSHYDDQFIDAAWEQDVLLERQYFIAYGKKWWRFLSGNYRRAKARLEGFCKKPLPKENDKNIQLIDAILDAQKHTEVYKQYEPLGAGLFGAQWQKENSDWQVLEKLMDWIVSLYQGIGDGNLPAGIIDFLEGSPRLVNLKGEVTKLVKEVKMHLELIKKIKIEFGVVSKQGDDLGSCLKIFPNFPLVTRQNGWRNGLISSTS